jgi:hypothetical protein
MILYFIGVALVGGVLWAGGQSWAVGLAIGDGTGAVCFGGDR